MPLKNVRNITLTLTEDDIRLLEELSNIRKSTKSEIVREALKIYNLFFHTYIYSKKPTV